MLLQIRQRFPHVRVLMLTMAEDGVHIREALRAGAAGYVLKSVGKDETGESPVYRCRRAATDSSDRVMQELYRHTEQPDEATDWLTALTGREIDVIKLIAQEHSSNQIAEMLFISLNTVETHRKNLFRKLNVKNSLGLIKFALKHGLTD